MEVAEAIRRRRSVRRYKPDALSPQLIREILDEARWTPSWRNTQSWWVWVLTGDTLARYKQAFTEKLVAQEDSTPDVVMPGREVPERCARRTMQLMDERAACDLAAGTDCSEEATFRRMGDLFGGPCLLVLGTDDCLPQGYACFDLGSLAQTICLAAQARGLGSCIMATAIRYPQVLREVLPDTDGKLFVTGIVLGYPDREAAINNFKRERAGLDEFVIWAE
jgi:nitroreductase